MSVPGIPTLGVHLLGDLEGIRVSQVRVGRGHGQDEAVLLGDKLHQHVPDLELNVGRLVPNWNLGHSRQVHQGQVQHWVGWREDRLKVRHTVGILRVRGFLDRVFRSLWPEVGGLRSSIRGMAKGLEELEGAPWDWMH